MLAVARLVSSACNCLRSLMIRAAFLFCEQNQIIQNYNGIEETEKRYNLFKFYSFTHFTNHQHLLSLGIGSNKVTVPLLLIG